MHANYARLFEPAYIEETPEPEPPGEGRLSGSSRGPPRARSPRPTTRRRRRSASRTRTRSRPSASVSSSATRSASARAKRVARPTLDVDAEAELAPAAPIGFAEGGGYDGPLAHRQGEPMRPDVALAFDRMEAAARADGVTLTITSGFRSDAEQAVLWARNPDPKWVARPGTSLHRNGTELDLGPPAAYALARGERAPLPLRPALRLGSPGISAITLNTASSPAAGDGAAGVARGAVPGFVPERFAPILRDAAQRWNVSAKLLAAQLYAESGFNPFAVSSAGAQGIAQFMPATARAFGLDEPVRPGAGDPRAGPLHARPAAPVRLGAARAGGLQRRAGARLGLRVRPEHPGDARLRRPDPRPDVRRGRADRARRSGARGPAGHDETSLYQQRVDYYDVTPVRTTVSRLDPDTRAARRAGNARARAELQGGRERRPSGRPRARQQGRRRTRRRGTSGRPVST